MKKNGLKLICLLFIVMGIAPAKAQETTEQPFDTLARSVYSLRDDVNKMKRLKITGYIQPQWQYIDSAGAPSFAGGDFNNSTGTNPYASRFAMRRGRFKFTYDYENVTLVINTDITEKGLFMRETFVKVTDPWLKIFSLTGGLLQVQFGYEVTYSSGERETPERARYNQILFPVERDLGAFGTILFPVTSVLSGVKIDLAVMNGSAGVAPEFDSNKDYTARLQYSKTTKNEQIAYAVGGSYYTGGYRIGSQKDFELKTLSNGDMGYVNTGDSANIYRLAVRNYYGADAQTSIAWRPGITTLRAEYIAGEQPGTSTGSRSPAGLPTSSIYHRAFNGAYFYFIQNIGQSKFQLVLKYDWYDPNTKISGKQIGKSGTATNVGDIRFDTYGFGMVFHMNPNVKLMTYYDLVQNESTSVTGYTKDIPDNVITVRLQAKF